MPKRRKKKHSTKPVEMPHMPFEGAIKKILNAPFVTKKKQSRKKG